MKKERPLHTLSGCYDVIVRSREGYRYMESGGFTMHGNVFYTVSGRYRESDRYTLSGRYKVIGRYREGDHYLESDRYKANGFICY